MIFCRRVCRMVAGEREMCKIQQVQVCKKVKLYLIFARFRNHNIIKLKIRLSVNHLYWYMFSLSFYVKFQHWSSWKIPMWYFPTWSFLIHHVKIILVFNLPYDVMKQLIYLWSIWSNNCLFFAFSLNSLFYDLFICMMKINYATAIYLWLNLFVCKLIWIPAIRN